MTLRFSPFPSDFRTPPGTCSIVPDDPPAGGGTGDDDDPDPDPEPEDPPVKKPKGEGVPTGDVLVLTRGQLNERLQRASIRKTLERYDVTSEEELDKLIARGRATATDDDDPAAGDPKPKAKPKAKPDEPIDADRYRRQAEKAKRDAHDLKAESERRLADAQTESELRIAAVSVGFDRSNLDVVLGRLHKHVRGLDETAIAKFDPDKWLGELAKKSPFLCRPDVADVDDTTTGGDGGKGKGDPDKGGGRSGAPTPKKPGGKDTPSFDAGVADADAVRKRRIELGLSPN